MTKLSGNAKRRAEWLEKQLANAESFSVILPLGFPQGNLTRKDIPTIEQARNVCKEMLDTAKAEGVNLYTRRPMIYIVTKGIPMTVHYENY